MQTSQRWLYFLLFQFIHREVLWETFTSLTSFTADLEWKVGEWGPCLVAENQILEYGTGLMQRNVTCVLNANPSFSVSFYSISRSELVVIDCLREYLRKCFADRLGSGRRQLLRSWLETRANPTVFTAHSTKLCHDRMDRMDALLRRLTVQNEDHFSTA